MRKLPRELCILNNQFDMVVLHRPGKLHLNADALSRIPDDLEYCGNFKNNVDITQLPCHPCHFCARAHKQWSRFIEDVDYVVPLSIRKIKLSTDVLFRTQDWGRKYSFEDLRNFQLKDTIQFLFIAQKFHGHENSSWKCSHF